LGKGLRGKVLGWGLWFVTISSGFRVGVQEYRLSLGFMHGVKGSGERLEFCFGIEGWQVSLGEGLEGVGLGFGLRFWIGLPVGG